MVTSFGESRPFIEYLIKHESLSSCPLVIFDCDHAKAPEYPCPAAMDDVRDVLDCVFRHPEIYDLQRVTIEGFSAGACMALGTSVQVGSELRKSTWPLLPPRRIGHSILPSDNSR
jgi:acetyl esterase/lipase